MRLANPFFPALRSGHPLFQRPSPRQFPGSMDVSVMPGVKCVEMVNAMVSEL